MRRALYVRNLRRLNDVLATTALAGRYWVWGGLLLGWAREGAVLANDYRDADFALLQEDVDRLHEAVPALVDAGFRRAFRFSNNDGTVTQYTFLRHGAKYEFFLKEPSGPNLRYYEYAATADGPIQQVAEVPNQDLSEFSFLDRSWLKHVDHERELEAIYGEWRIPDPAWSFTEERSIIARLAWTNTDYEWG